MVRRRTPLSARTRLAIAILIAFTGLVVYAKTILVGPFRSGFRDPRRRLVARRKRDRHGWRWTPQLESLLSSLNISGSPDLIVHKLHASRSLRLFARIV